MDKNLLQYFGERWQKYFPGADLPIVFYYSDKPCDEEKAPPAREWRCIICDLGQVRKGKSLSFDIEAVGMEYSVVLKGVQRAGEMLDTGQTSEVSVQTERLTTVVRMLTDEYFVALAVAPGGNVGKARFVLRTSAAKLLENL